MHDLAHIATLAGGLTAALVAGYVTERLRLSPIVGYLLAGIAVGPHTPGFTADTHLAEQLAEVGVILLMFGVGLQFHLDELLSVRRVAVPGAIAQSAVATALGAGVAHLFGWDWRAAIVFGIALAVASTVVLIRILSDNRELHTPTGHIAVGWLVVEDLFTVLVLVVLPALLAANASTGPLWWGRSFSPAVALALTIALTLLKVVGLAVFTLSIGGRVLPRLLDRIARTRSRELFTLTVLVIALGIAVGSAVIFGVSMALGAFLAGMVVGRSEYSLRAASEALPMRDAFAVLFFVSVGMLLDPRYLFQAPGLIAATLAVVVIGKPLVAIVVVLLMRYPMRVALAIGVALAQIGEFSFILGSMGRDLGILSRDATQTLVAVAIASIVINPLLFRWVPDLARRTRPAPAETPDDQSRRSPTSNAHRAVVVGYGPTGRTVTRLLRENGIEPTVVELNIDTVRTLGNEGGVVAVYGDASQREVLKGAGTDTAGSLIVTTDLASAEEVIRAARELNPGLHVLSRTANLRDVPALRAAGASGVFSGEGEVALALTAALLQRLGATPDQIDGERKRVHDELIG